MWILNLFQLESGTLSFIISHVLAGEGGKLFYWPKIRRCKARRTKNLETFLTQMKMLNNLLVREGESMTGGVNIVTN